MYKLKTIKQKMLLGFSIVMLVVLVQGLSSFIKVKQVNDNIDSIIDRQLVFMIANETIAYNTANQLLALNDYVWSGGETANKERFDSLAGEIQAEQDKVLKRNTLPEVEDLMKRVDSWQEKVEKEIIANVEGGNEKAAQANMDKVEKEGHELMSIFEKLSDDREKAITDSGDAIMDSSLFTLYIIGISTLIVLVLTFVIAQLTSAPISRNVRTVSERMKELASGDLSSSLLAVKSADEVGELMESLNIMTENNRAMLAEISEVSGKASRQSEELTQAATEVKAGSEQIASTMEELAAGSESQANRSGELSSMMQAFSGKIAETNVNGEKIQSASDHIVEMTAEGSGLMEQSTKQMDKIDAIVREAVAKVEGLDSQSQEISKLVSVIKAIAEQTNLLALNAAIEAARAGEQGKGFAVVADEVRKLAEQVAVSVTDITDIVAAIQQESQAVTFSLQDGYREVEQGTKQVRATGATFVGIDQALHEMSGHIGQISGNLEEITASSRQMNHSIEEIAAVSEESAAGVEETSATAQQSLSAMEEIANSSVSLADLSEQLNSLVKQFKL